MSESPIDFLRHILDECNFIISVTTPQLTKNDFHNDETLKRAVVRSLEVMGEASKKIGIDWKPKWNTIEWRQIAGMRDRLIHDYIGINYNIVWDVMINKIPTLKIQVSEVISEFK